MNPRRDLLCLPVRVRNPTPDREATFDVAFDFWDIMLDPDTPICVELGSASSDATGTSDRGTAA